jgi:hypothetical protein
MDVCTLIIAGLMALPVCYSHGGCHTSTDGTKQLCTGVHLITCNQECPGRGEHQDCSKRYVPTYDCKRPDGSSYTWRDEKFETTSGE